MEMKILSTEYYFSTKFLILYIFPLISKFQKVRNEILVREGSDRVLSLSTGVTFLIILKCKYNYVSPLSKNLVASQCTLKTMPNCLKPTRCYIWPLPISQSNLIQSTIHSLFQHQIYWLGTLGPEEQHGGKFPGFFLSTSILQTWS